MLSIEQGLCTCRFQNQDFYFPHILMQFNLLVCQPEAGTYFTLKMKMEFLPVL